MSMLPFDTKSWDKVRPKTLKKTGVTEAINAFVKVAPEHVSDLQTPKAFSEVVTSLESLTQKLKLAKEKMNKEADAKSIIAVSGWLTELHKLHETITAQQTKVTEAIDLKLQTTKQVVEKYFAQVSGLMDQTHQLISDVQDDAKKILLASARGEPGTVITINKDVKAKGADFELIKKSIGTIWSKVKQEYAEARPNEKDLIKGSSQETAYNRIEERFLKIKGDIQSFTDLEHDFNGVVDDFHDAVKSGENVEDSFAKMVERDLASCEKLASQAAHTEALVSIDIEKTRELVKKAQSSTDGKEQTIAEAAILLKEAIGKLQRYHIASEAAGKLKLNKFAAYPDFVSNQNPKFAPLMQDWANFDITINDQKKHTVKFATQLKELSTELEELK